MYARCPGIGKLVNAIGANYASAIPGAADVLPDNDLGETAGLDMSYLDEGWAKEDNIGWMPGCV